MGSPGRRHRRVEAWPQSEYILELTKQSRGWSLREQELNEFKIKNRKNTSEKYNPLFLLILWFFRTFSAGATGAAGVVGTAGMSCRHEKLLEDWLWRIRQLWRKERSLNQDFIYCHDEKLLQDWLWRIRQLWRRRKEFKPDSIYHGKLWSIFHDCNYVIVSIWSFCVWGWNVRD